jgi:ATP-dependent helicase HrpB
VAVDLAPTGLPVEDAVADVRAALAGPGVAVLQAEPGAGKTTVVPLRLFDEPWRGDGRIVVLEPRRLATRAAARRMADLLGEEVGATVGYRTRDERHVGPSTRVEVLTEGILTRRLQSDPSLDGTALVVFDEVHERHLQTDLALALALDARAGLRPDLRLLAMSATPDAGRLAAVLGDAPVVTSPGRTFPVDVRWRPPGPRDRALDAVAAVVHEAVRVDEGDVLVFLAGAADIRRVGERLRGLPDHVDVRPLHGSLPPAEQDLALAPSPAGRRRVVLSTDIAESSLTVDGVRVVVDAGEVRRPRHDARSGLSRLHTTSASKASADQRAGRAGRLGPGVAYRTWSAADHASRRAFAEPEIRSADLAGLALELAAWGADEASLPFLDAPPPVPMADARVLLTRLRALDPEDGRLTELGRSMADLPVHPRLARMVLDHRDEVACALAAVLEEGVVLRGRPEELEADAAERARLVLDARRTHPRLDAGARRTAQRRARELARRAGIEWSPATPTDVGPVLGLAYPDRIAQPRGGGRWVLRSGRGVSLGRGDALSGSDYLVVADLAPPAPGEADARIRIAAPIDGDDLEDLAGDDVVAEDTLTWSPQGTLVERTAVVLDALTLSSTDRPAEPGEATTAALVDRVVTEGLGVLRWTTAARTLQARAGFARRHLGDPWPEVDDDALLASVDEWLAPRLHRATRWADVQRVDLLDVLRGLLGHRLHELDQAVPPTVLVPSGRPVAVDYASDPPSIRVRAQELYGSWRHPTVANGRVPLTVEVLSPAQRPIQVTADLPGFWAGSWAAVRKEMISAYPKHDWPADPTVAEPSTRARRGR